MKVMVLYRPVSEHSRQVETFIHDFNAIHGEDKLDIIDVDSRDGIAIASLYGIMQFPAILAVNEQGSLLKGWEGDSLPLKDDVAFYTRQT